MNEGAAIIGNGKIIPPGTPIVPVRDPADPPVFILLASPTWAPWLPDTAYQKVPIGGTGQVLTVNADGSIGWGNNPAGFTNPMTAAGDLIDGGAAGTPQRLAVGANGTVLTVVAGAPAWSAAGGFANPMTTTQDMIVAGAAGVAGRLPAGANGQVLTVTGGLVGWANSAAGFVNPMTTLGDIITAASGGAAQRLGVGAANQVLTVVGGVPAWANSAAGFANPMTQQGDMITGGLVGVATRLPVGASGQVLTVVSGQPAWASGQSAASAVVFPSGDATGVKDQAAITSAYPPNGGEVLLANGQFYVKPTSGLRCLSPPQITTTPVQGNSNGGWPVCIRGLGASTVLYPVGAGITGIYFHRTAGYGAQYGNPAQPQTGYLRDFVIDGTNATGAAIGVDWGDGWGYELDLGVVNFNTTGAIGVQQINRVFWTEKCDRIRLRLSNNSTQLYITTALAPGGDHSSEYNMYDISMFCQANQQGIVVDGVNMGGSYMWIRGNMSVSNGSGAAPPNNIACLSIINAAGVTATDGHRWYAGGFYFKVEANSGNGTGSTFPYVMYSDGVGYVRQCVGSINASGLTPSNWNGAEFTFRGQIADSVLAQLDTGPAGSGSNGQTCTYQAFSATTTSGSPNFTVSPVPTFMYQVGTLVTLSGTIPGGFSANTFYYVVSLAGGVVTLSATFGGAAINATTTVSSGLTINPGGPGLPASGTLQQNYGPDVQVFLLMTGATVTGVTLQGNPVGTSLGPYFIPAGGSIQVSYTGIPTQTWLWAPCSQSQY
jgi:hypothetical protein